MSGPTPAQTRQIIQDLVNALGKIATVPDKGGPQTIGGARDIANDALAAMPRRYMPCGKWVEPHPSSPRCRLPAGHDADHLACRGCGNRYHCQCEPLQAQSYATEAKSPAASLGGSAASPSRVCADPSACTCPPWTRWAGSEPQEFDHDDGCPRFVAPPDPSAREVAVHPLWVGDAALTWLVKWGIGPDTAALADLRRQAVRDLLAERGE